MSKACVFFWMRMLFWVIFIIVFSASTVAMFWQFSESLGFIENPSNDMINFIYIAKYEITIMKNTSMYSFHNKTIPMDNISMHLVDDHKENNDIKSTWRSTLYGVYDYEGTVTSWNAIYGENELKELRRCADSIFGIRLTLAFACVFGAGSKWVAIFNDVKDPTMGAKANFRRFYQKFNWSYPVGLIISGIFFAQDFLGFYTFLTECKFNESGENYKVETTFPDHLLSGNLSAPLYLFLELLYVVYCCIYLCLQYACESDGMYENRTKYFYSMAQCEYCGNNIKGEYIYTRLHAMAHGNGKKGGGANVHMCI